jgi:hypothetical protein
LILLAGVALAAEPPPNIVAPVSEVSHPVYVDAAGTTVQWPDLRRLSRGTDERAKVRGRRFSRMFLGLAFAGATAVEVWGGVELAQGDERYRWIAVPLFIQAGFTGACSILTFTRIPGDVKEDRALLINAVNAKLE